MRALVRRRLHRRRCIAILSDEPAKTRRVRRSLLALLAGVVTIGGSILAASPAIAGSPTAESATFYYTGSYGQIWTASSNIVGSVTLTVYGGGGGTTGDGGGDGAEIVENIGSVAPGTQLAALVGSGGGGPGCGDYGGSTMYGWDYGSNPPTTPFDGGFGGSGCGGSGWPISGTGGGSASAVVSTGGAYYAIVGGGGGAGGDGLWSGNLAPGGWGGSAGGSGGCGAGGGGDGNGGGSGGNPGNGGCNGGGGAGGSGGNGQVASQAGGGGGSWGSAATAGYGGAGQGCSGGACGGGGGGGGGGWGAGGAGGSGSGVGGTYSGAGGGGGAGGSWTCSGCSVSVAAAGNPATANGEVVIQYDIGTAPTFSSASSTTFTTGSAGSFSVTTSTSSYPTPSLSESGTLPSGVTFVDNGTGTGTLSGTPAAGSGGSYPITLTATNSSGTTTQSFTLTVDQAPAITSSSSTTFNADTAGTFSVTTASGGYPTPTMSESGTLPSGVTFHDNGSGTGTLSGIPATGTGGLYGITLTAANGVGSPAAQAFALTVDEAPSNTSPPSLTDETFTVGTSGTFTATFGGYPYPTIAESGTLPTGLTFTDNGTGSATVAGTPAPDTGGAYPIVITANNGSGPVTQDDTIYVDQPPAITSASATTFTTNESGTFGVTTTGYPAPSLIETGTLPSGVTFTDNGGGAGTLAGTPASGTGGVYDFSIKATNGVGTAATQSFVLTVDQPPAITSPASATFTTGQAGSFGITTTGWPLPSETEAGTLPSGVSFHDNGNGTATLSGTPAAGTGGVYDFSITATNGVGTAATQSFVLTIDQPAALTSNPFTTFTVGAAGLFTATSTGYPTPTLGDTGPWPSGVAFRDNGDGTGTLSGTPGTGTGGIYDSTLSAQNGVGSPATQSFALTVNEAPSFTSSAATTFTSGSASSFDFTPLGWPLPSYTETGTLPAGVTFVDNGNGTATLAGTPAAGTGGVYTFSVEASNSVTSTTETFTLTIDQQAVITSGSSATFVIGTAGSFSVDTAGYPAPTLTVTGALPSGVSLHDNGDGTASLSGTPTAGMSGIYSLSFTAHNGVSTDHLQNFTLTIDQASALTSPGAVTFSAGQAGDFEITSTGYPTPALTVTGALPSGVSLHDNGDGTASLSGTPTAGTGGSYTVTITADNDVAEPSTQTLTIAVDETPTITSSASGTFTVGQSSSFTFAASGFPAPTFTAPADEIPVGLQLTSTGVLFGDPHTLTGGIYQLSVSAENGIGAGTSQQFELVIDEAPAYESPVSTTFVEGTTGSLVITSVGYPTPSLSETGRRSHRAWRFTTTVRVPGRSPAHPRWFCWLLPGSRRRG